MNPRRGNKNTLRSGSPDTYSPHRIPSPLRLRPNLRAKSPGKQSEAPALGNISPSNTETPYPSFDPQMPPVVTLDPNDPNHPNNKKLEHPALQ